MWQGWICYIFPWKLHIYNGMNNINSSKNLIESNTNPPSSRELFQNKPKASVSERWSYKEIRVGIDGKRPEEVVERKENIRIVRGSKVQLQRLGNYELFAWNFYHFVLYELFLRLSLKMSDDHKFPTTVVYLKNQVSLSPHYLRLWIIMIFLMQKSGCFSYGYHIDDQARLDSGGWYNIHNLAVD